MPSSKCRPDHIEKVLAALSGPLILSRQLVVEHLHPQLYPAHKGDDLPPRHLRLKRLRDIAKAAIAELENAGQVKAGVIDACSALPETELVFDSEAVQDFAADIYSRMHRCWWGHSGTASVEVVGLPERIAEAQRLNVGQRSEPISSMMVIGRVFVSRSRAEQKTWDRDHQTYTDPRLPDACRHFEQGCYTSDEGKPVRVCVPVVGYWWRGDEEKRVDEANVTRVLRSILDECHASRTRLLIYVPAPKSDDAKGGKR